MVPLSPTTGTKSRKTTEQDARVSPPAFSGSVCSERSCDSLLGVVEPLIVEPLCSEGVHEDIPFRDILVCMSGLPVQL